MDVFIIKNNRSWGGVGSIGSVSELVMNLF